MFQTEYIFKFYLNAVHATAFNGTVSASHPHTWELCLHISQSASGEMRPFNEIEEKIKTFFHIYEGQDLNQIPPFDQQNPTMETLAEVFFSQLKNILRQNEWKLKKLIISENPSRSYVVESAKDSPAAAFGSQPSEAETPQEPEAMQEHILERNNTLEASLLTVPAQLTEEGAQAKNTVDGLRADSMEEESDPFEEAADPTDSPEPAVPETSKQKRRRIFRTILVGSGIVLLLIGLAVLTEWFINRDSINPWGPDTWGHLFKGRFLYENLKEGNLYPLYMPEWYNGLQPFRYWPPMTYYILSFFYFVTGGDPFSSNILFEMLVFVVGALGFVLWGKKYHRLGLGLLFGVLWFFIPDNLRVLFGEGNLPRVTITMVIPLFSYFVFGYMKEEKLSQLVASSLLMAFITMTHLMITAMLGLTVFLSLSIYSAFTRQWKRSLRLLVSLVLGIGLCAVWVIPALEGGILSEGGEASNTITEMLTSPVTMSLNPVSRLIENDRYYYGLGFFAIALFGIAFAKRQGKTGFIMAVIIFIGTLKAVLPVISMLPFSQVFWMMRFTPFAMLLLLVSILLWKDAKRWVVVLMALLVTAECAFSFPLLGYRKDIPERDMDGYETVVAETASRTALMDLSGRGAFPSYYIPRNDTNYTDYVFGWAWQGATTGQNIVQLNEALEKGHFAFLFDRAVELGADTLTFPKFYIRDTNGFLTAMVAAQYRVIFEDEDQYVCKRDLPAEYGTIPGYRGIGIGGSAANVIYTFPLFRLGGSEYLDDYAAEDLAAFDTVFLSGFKYRSKEYAERLVRELSADGKRVVVDINNLQQDLFTRRNSFLGVSAQAISYTGTFPAVTANGETYGERPLPSNYDNWNTTYSDEKWATSYNDNSTNVIGFTEVDGRQLPFWTEQDGVQFIGLNLPYYVSETDDPEMLSLLGELLRLKPYEVPEREIVPLSVTIDQNHITIRSPKDGVLTTLANVAGFQSGGNQPDGMHNLMLVDSGTTEVVSSYPHLLLSVSMSGFFLAAMLCWFWFNRRRRNKPEKHSHTGWRRRKKEDKKDDFNLPFPVDYWDHKEVPL